MPDPRLANLANILVTYSTRVKPGQQAAIFTQPIALPLAEEVYRAVLAAGGYPSLLLGGLYSGVETENLEYIVYTQSNQEQLQHISPIETSVIEAYDVIIVIESQTNTRGLGNVDPARQRLRAQASAPLGKRWMERSGAGELKWVACLYPTPAYAQDAAMSLAEFEDFVYAATYADTEDPIAVWQVIHDEQQRLVDWLRDKEQVVVQGPDVDLTFSIKDRPFVNSDGDQNMPSGEIFTSPVEDSVNGWVRFSFPAIINGRRVEGIELNIEKGRVFQASAEKDEAFLLQMLDVDEGARTIGEFGIGTNHQIKRFIGNLLFDEKIGGTIHLALGSGFPEAGGQNTSGIHWDMLCNMRNGGQILVDGELFYDSGVFKI